MIRFGTHFLLTIRRGERERVRAFYNTLLGCKLHSSDDITEKIPEHVDIFEFPGGEMLGVQFIDDGAPALSNGDHRLAAWMEVASDDVEGLKQQLLEFGVEEITDFWDKGHFYFHAPGGQVFRIVGTDEGPA